MLALQWYDYWKAKIASQMPSDGLQLREMCDFEGYPLAVLVVYWMDSLGRKITASNGFVLSFHVFIIDSVYNICYIYPTYLFQSL
jgi:hypothetical protein